MHITRTQQDLIEDDNNAIIKIYVYSLENKRRYNKITSMKYALNQEIGVK